MKKFKIAVAGTGYVGLSLSVLLAQHNQVMAVDIVQAKVDMINNHKSPIQDDYIEKYLAEKELNLTATLDAKTASTRVVLVKSTTLAVTTRSRISYFKKLHIIGITYRAITWACIFLIIFRWLKYVNDGLITTKCFFLQSTILAISFLSYFKSGRDELLLAMIFIVGAINTERDKVFRIAYRASMLGTLIVTGCYLSGIINSSVTNSLRDGVNVARYSMGFSHPNI